MVRRIALLAVATAGLAAAPASALTVSPAPDTPAASPDTQISVLGVKPGDIDSVTVTGASSGSHRGKLQRYSRGRGASFIPSKPLTQGERVAVVVKIDGHKARRFSFTVATLAPLPPVLDLPQEQPAKLRSFVSRPDLRPPKIVADGKASGSIFLTPLPSPVVHPGSTATVSITPVGPGGAMILDSRGELVWFKQVEHPTVAANLRIQRYDGRSVLTWWEGGVTPTAFGIGAGIIADTSYRTIKRVKAGNGYPMDIHEFELTPDGDALFTIYSQLLVHLPGTPAGKKSPLMDSIVQQVDIKTGLVVWEWHAYGNIALDESQATPQNSASYDAFHLNSIQQLNDDRVLVSARDTSALYEVDRSSGKIVWRLGGTDSDFRLGPGARFWFQHDARMLDGDRVSLFDDEAGPPQKAPASRGLILQLDRRKKTARVVSEFKRAPDTSAQSEGSTQLLDDGNVFVGFGSEPFFSEFSAKGKRLFDASLPKDDGSYRVLTFPWKATPHTKPDAAAVSVYASWNGATEVARWQVVDAQSGEALATAGREGFETRIDVTGGATSFAVRALDAKGKVLATSAAVAAP
jgi:hypothetical protein